LQAAGVLYIFNIVEVFRWNDWNRDHATRHGVSIPECQQVLRGARRPFPIKIGRGKWMVHARGQADRMVQVIYLIDPDGSIFVIHAMPLTTRRRRR
jgi:hypothetical protein